MELVAACLRVRSATGCGPLLAKLHGPRFAYTASPYISMPWSADGTERSLSRFEPSGGFVLVAAGQEIEKLPLRELSRPMTGNQPSAVAAKSNRHRQL